MRRTWLLWLLLLAPSIFAQIAERVDVTVVEVPVTVSDRSGNAVRGLTKANFELLVDGKKVPVEYFEAVDLTKITTAQEDSLPAAAHRNFLLLFDVANASPITMGRAQDAARQFVETQLADRDLAAVATFTLQDGANMVTSFTRDKEMLLAAIGSLGGAQHFEVADPIKLSANYTEQQGAVPVGGRGGGEIRQEALTDNRERLKDYNTQTAISNENEQRTQVRTQLQNFGAVARALDRLRGQKQIILLSEGFDPWPLMGRRDLTSRETQKENDSLAHGEIWDVDNEKRFAGSAHLGAVHEMAELFRRSDVRLHAIDIRGVRGNVQVRDGEQNASHEGLYLITRPTGGTVFTNDNDLSARFASLLKRQEVVYVVGFKARDVSPGTFHPLRVKLVGAKGEIVHRSGYYDEQPNKSELEATLEYAEVLQTRSVVRDVPLTLTVLPLPGDEEARVPVVVDAAGEGFLRDVDGPAVTANIFVYAFDEKGKVRDSAQQRVGLDLSKMEATVRATGVRFIGSLRLPPGNYTVKAMVRVDESGRLGLTTTRVVVPEFGETAVLPPVAVGAIGRWVTVISRARGGEAAHLLTLGDRPFIPLSRGELSAAPLDVAVLIRGMEIGNLQVTPSLVTAGGTATPVDVTLSGRTEPDEHGLAALLFRVAPQTIASGDYELRFTIGSDVVRIPVVMR